jgi:SAM-dependent methyltransferase
VTKTKDLLASARAAHNAAPTEHSEALVAHFEAAQAAEIGGSGKQGIRDYLRNDFHQTMKDEGIHSGLVAELGGSNNSFEAEMPDYDFQFLSLYPHAQKGKHIVADATQCDHLEDEQYDAIYSMAVFEHISKPWKAAENMVRLLKPGGVCYTAAPFSYFYHGAPADFWRFTPDALQLIFSELRPVRGEFYGQNRRRDNRGSKANAVDRDGGAPFAVDAFGGWRENWFTIFAGVKDDAYLTEKMLRAKMQVAVNGMKVLVTDKGMDPADAAVALQTALTKYDVTRDGEIVPSTTGGANLSLEDITQWWETRGRNGTRPDPMRFTMVASLGL